MVKKGFKNMCKILPIHRKILENTSNKSLTLFSSLSLSHTHTYMDTCVYVYVKVLVAPSCPTLCNPMDCSPPGSSVHGISQARILEWVAMSFSRGSSPPRDKTHLLGRWIPYHWVTKEDTHTHTHKYIWQLCSLYIHTYICNILFIGIYMCVCE